MVLTEDSGGKISNGSRADLRRVSRMLTSIDESIRCREIWRGNYSAVNRIISIFEAEMILPTSVTYHKCADASSTRH